jgi:homoserine kinase
LTLLATAPLVAIGLGGGLDGIAIPLVAHPVQVRSSEGDVRAADPSLDPAIAALCSALGREAPAAQRVAHPAGPRAPGLRAAALVAWARAIDGEAPVTTLRAACNEAARAMRGPPIAHAIDAALTGLPCFAASQHPPILVPLRPAASLWLVAIVPDASWESAWRRADIPAQVAGLRARENTARGAGFVAALAAGDLAALRTLAPDRFMGSGATAHLPGYFPLAAALEAAGATAPLACADSPALVSFCADPDVAERAVEAATVALSAHGIRSVGLIEELHGRPH